MKYNTFSKRDQNNYSEHRYQKKDLEEQTERITTFIETIRHNKMAFNYFIDQTQSIKNEKNSSSAKKTRNF